MLNNLLVLLSALLVSFSQSMKTLKRAIIDSRTSVLKQSYLDLTIYYLRNSDYRRAREKLAKALEIEPKNTVVLWARGLVYQLDGENDLDKGYFSRAVRYGAQSAWIRNRYVGFLSSEKRFCGAVVQLSNAIDALEEISTSLDKYKQYQESI
jgi:Tfp pilus assembly protein PilF